MKPLQSTILNIMHDYRLGHSYNEMARAYGLTKGQVAGIIFRARKKAHAHQEAKGTPASKDRELQPDRRHNTGAGGTGSGT